jgi:hypothetical protein
MMADDSMRARLPMSNGRIETFELVVGPVLFAVGLAVTYFIPDIGPLDRAKVQGFIGLPLMAAGPGVAGLAGRTPDGRSRAQLVIRATAAGIGALAIWMTVVSVAFVGCRPVTSPIDVFPYALVVGLLAATTYGVAGTAALGSAARGRRGVAVAIGAGTFVGLAAVSVLVIFTALFPPLSCAPPH